MLCQLLLFRGSVWVSKYLISPGGEVSFLPAGFTAFIIHTNQVYPDVTGIVLLQPIGE